MKKYLLTAALCTFSVLASSASAGPVKVPLIAASASDVKLDAKSANAYAYLGKVNPQGVASSSTFDDDFAGTWSAIGAFADGGKATQANGQVSSPLSFKFAFGADLKNGTWSVTNTLKDTDIMLDLVFAMHTGGGSGAWLFDDHVFKAGTTQSGSWVQRMLNNGKNAGDFSNVTLFQSGMKLIPPPTPEGGPTALPEPATLGTLIFGLGLLAYMRRRKQS